MSRNLRVAVGTVKLGRVMDKYTGEQALPAREEAIEILRELWQMQRRYFGQGLMDTAPSYASAEQSAEELVGAVTGGNPQVEVMTKVGERFEGMEKGKEKYVHDFSPKAVRQSVLASCNRLKLESLACVHVHAPHDDLPVAQNNELWETLRGLREAGRIERLGFSGYTTEAFETAIAAGAQSIMVDYNAGNTRDELLMQRAKEKGVQVVVKKPLGYGQLVGKMGLKSAVEFFKDKDFVDVIVLGTTNPKHFQEFCEILRG